MIRFLLEKQLIKEVGKKEAPGRPVQYGTTKEFLKLFRLGSIADLPRLDELESERFSLESDAKPASGGAGEDTSPAEDASTPAPRDSAEPDLNREARDE
jgi:hypothetical protein